MEGSGDSWERVETPSFFGLLGFRVSDMLLIEGFFWVNLCLDDDGGCLCSCFRAPLCLREGSEGNVRWTVRRRERKWVPGMNEKENVSVVRS